MNTSQFATELLNQFLLTDESKAITKLETLKAAFTEMLRNDRNQAINDWGRGYRQCKIDIAKAVLEYLED